MPQARGLIKNRYVYRTFIQPDQHLRELGIRMKLNPVRSLIEGKRLVVVDDSMVRGTTIRSLVTMLKEAGASEVHVRISSPRSCAHRSTASTHRAGTSASRPAPTWRRCVAPSAPPR